MQVVVAQGCKQRPYCLVGSGLVYFQCSLGWLLALLAPQWLSEAGCGQLRWVSRLEICHEVEIEGLENRCGQSLQLLAQVCHSLQSCLQGVVMLHSH